MSQSLKSLESSLTNNRSLIAPTKSAPLAALTARTAARASQKEPGGTLKSALRVRPLPGTFNRRDSTSRSDLDLYRLVVRNPSTADIVFRKGGSQGVQLAVLNARGKVLTFGGQKLSTTVLTGVRRFSLSGILPGTYFVRVSTPSQSAVKYRLRI
ncbi:MAG: hypothetical protein Fur0046_22020 [Cyanobacteria bacterium J069]|nr:MAG: T9SS C-terminal target domain-containing protein [Cyanobacteria bacterium J069]